MLNRDKAEISAALPPTLQGIRELMRICRIEQPEFAAVWPDIERVLAEQYPLICSEYGLSRWEKLLGLLPGNNAGKEERLQAIFFRLNEQLPFTFARLRQLIALIVPENEYSIEFFDEEKRFVIRLSLYCKKVERLLSDLLRRTLPANILWELAWFYNKHLFLQRYTYGELSSFTHYYIREETLK